MGYQRALAHHRPRILIAGLGNPSHRDDGAGAHAVHWLRRRRWPRNVWVAELGTVAVQAARLIERADAVLAIYSLAAGGSPGDLYFHPLDGGLSPERTVSSHEFTLVSALEFLTAAPPPIWILGIHPESTSVGFELSPAVVAAMPGLELRVREFIASFSTESAAASLSRPECLARSAPVA